MASIIYRGAPGTLPLTIQYIPDSDDLSTLYLFGSAWSTNTNVLIGITVSINGQAVTTANVFNNQPSEHRALVPGVADFRFPMMVYNGELQPVSITFAADNENTVFDKNDFVGLMIL